MSLWNRILVGVDDNEHSLGALHYLATVLGGSSACQVFILAVLRGGDADMYSGQDEWREELEKRREALRARLKQAVNMLAEAGIPRGNLATRLVESADLTVGEVLLREQESGGFGTIVVGRRGISKQEEFLFGSVSTSLVRHAHECAIWVVP